MKSWKRILAALLLTMFVASSCSTLGPLTEEEEESLEEQLRSSGD